MKHSNQTKRLPPGQQRVAPGKWPIIGERKSLKSDRPWMLEITGNVLRPTRFSVDDLLSFPQIERVHDIHCVTRWSMLDVGIQGVLLADLLHGVGVEKQAQFVSFVARSVRDHSSSLTLETAIELETMIALRVNGEPLSPEHGGPIRNFVPGRYFYKSVKWLTRIELLAEDRLGFWEAETGYHNRADPWKEERYMVPSLDRREVVRLLEARDFSGQLLRSIDASNRQLDRLNARNATLRDANFENASLATADFSGANLSNAHFQNANLNGAKFNGADLEGAEFAGADLRGANLTDCSLIGATFCHFDGQGNPANIASIDPTTIIPLEILAPLVPAQCKFVSSQLKR